MAPLGKLLNFGRRILGKKQVVKAAEHAVEAGAKTAVPVGKPLSEVQAAAAKPAVRVLRPTGDGGIITVGPFKRVGTDGYNGVIREQVTTNTDKSGKTVKTVTKKNTCIEPYGRRTHIPNSTVIVESNMPNGTTRVATTETTRGLGSNRLGTESTTRYEVIDPYGYAHPEGTRVIKTIGNHKEDVTIQFMDRKGNILDKNPFAGWMNPNPPAK